VACTHPCTHPACPKPPNLKARPQKYNDSGEWCKDRKAMHTCTYNMIIKCVYLASKLPALARERSMYGKLSMAKKLRCALQFPNCPCLDEPPSTPADHASDLGPRPAGRPSTSQGPKEEELRNYGLMHLEVHL